MNPSENTPPEDLSAEISVPEPPASTSQRVSARVAPPQPPTARQLAESRKERWHQDGKPLLTHEALREWITRSGMVAYGQRALQLGSPAPSVLEAVQGSSLDPETPLAAAVVTRALLTRLIAEGSVVPLNLLGASGGLGTDTPDFVASAAVFSYIFTLRGAKAWKQPPATSGSIKVSPLALAIYEMLDAKVTLSAAELATNLGKEVTESAVLRALNELWGQLRVLPLPQPDDAPTQWELASARFTKQIKSGANAGQPSALSAIITLYLGQALAATEDEVETFLSPLAPRSKVRDVLHALLPARQLETIVVDGKTLLHIAGELPAFNTAARPAAAQDEAPAELAEGGSRIRKFSSKPGSKIGTGLRARPSFKPGPGFAGKSRPPGKPGFSPRPSSSDRERRPFRRDGEERPRAARPAFDKPWQEDRRPRPEAAPDLGASASPEARPRRTFSKPGTFSRKREGSASGFEPRPRKSFDRGGARPSRPYSAERSSGERSYGERPERPTRAPRRDGFDSANRPADSRPAASSRPAPGSYNRDNSRPFNDKPAGKPFGSKPFGSKPFGSKPFGNKPFGSKPAGKSFGGKSFSKPFSGEKPGGYQRERPDAGSSSEAPRKTYRKFDAPREAKPFRKNSGGPTPDRAAGRFDQARPPRPFADRPARSSGEGTARPQGSPGAKPFRSKPAFGSKPGGKPAFGAKKPFARDGSAKPGQGGFKPVKRQRPEGNR